MLEMTERWNLESGLDGIIGAYRDIRKTRVAWEMPHTLTERSSEILRADSCLLPAFVFWCAICRIGQTCWTVTAIDRGAATRCLRCWDKGVDGGAGGYLHPTLFRRWL